MLYRNKANTFSLLASLCSKTTIKKKISIYLKKRKETKPLRGPTKTSFCVRGGWFIWMWFSRYFDLGRRQGMSSGRTSGWFSYVTDSLLKDLLTLTVMQCALFILIRPRGKITASHLEEEMNTEFEMSVVSNFLVSTSSPVRYQKPVKYFCGPCFGPLNPPSCSSRRGHFLQKSHLKEK